MRHFLSSLLVALPLVAQAQSAPPAIPQDPALEAKVQQTLARMTLAEKVGQMCQLTADPLTNMERTKSTGKFTFDPAAIERVIGEYKVGSILNAPLTTAQTPEAYAKFIEAIQKVSMKKIGIPNLYGLDQNHGTTYTLGGTIFPQNLNLGATFNRALTQRSTEICAYETRACLVPWTFNPTIDLARHPAWPRFWENFGEDTYVNAEMGRVAVLGYQGDNPNNVDKYHIAASLKHYMAYGASVSGRDRTPSSVNRSDMREKHFEPFRAAVRAGALSIMVNSGNDNGMPFHANHELLTQWLKEDLNWDGVIVTDWADIDNLFKRDYVAANKKEAIAMAINAGIDLSMDPYDVGFCTLLMECVNEGKVPQSRIDDAVARILRMKYRLGLFDNPTWNWKRDYPLFGSKEHAAVALQAAEESMVLLKNTNNLLPLRAGQKILLTGPNADSRRALNGGWTYTWQGHRTDELAPQYATLRTAFEQRFGRENVIYSPGVAYPVADDANSNWQKDSIVDLQATLAAARQSDVIVVAIGENSYCETPGNITDLRLSANQRELVKALATTGRPIVLVINAGRPRIIEDIEPLAQAVVNIMLPGNYGAEALANLLSGDSNFSGKLPFTYPRHTNALSTYDYKPCEHVGTMEGNYNYDAQVYVQWPFGAGESYTRFSYTNLRVDKTNFTASDTLTVQVDVTNVGQRAGKESVLLYSRDLVATSTPDVRRLRAFDKVELQPGEKRTVTLRLPAADLAFVGYDGRWRLEAGQFLLFCGDQQLSINATATRLWKTPNR